MDAVIVLVVCQMGRGRDTEIFKELLYHYKSFITMSSSYHH